MVALTVKIREYLEISWLMTISCQPLDTERCRPAADDHYGENESIISRSTGKLNLAPLVVTTFKGYGNISGNTNSGNNIVVTTYNMNLSELMI